MIVKAPWGHVTRSPRRRLTTGRRRGKAPGPAERGLQGSKGFSALCGWLWEGGVSFTAIPIPECLAPSGAHQGRCMPNRAGLSPSWIVCMPTKYPCLNGRGKGSLPSAYLSEGMPVVARARRIGRWRGCGVAAAGQRRRGPGG